MPYRELQTPVSVRTSKDGTLINLKRGDWIVELKPGEYRHTNVENAVPFTLPQAVINLLMDTGETTDLTFQDTSR